MYMEIQRTILKKKKKAAGILLPVFETYYECTLIRQCDIHRHSNETD